MRLRLAAIALLVAGLLAPAAAAPGEHGLLVRCQARITGASNAFLARRRQALTRCLQKAWRCPAALGSPTGAAEDPCLAAVAVRCAARLAAVRAPQLALERSGPACTAPAPAGIGVPLDAFLDPVDGLAFGSVTAFCPHLAVRPDAPDDASRCQRYALACAEDSAFAASAPRAAELLARLGLPLESGPGCLGATLCGNGRLDRDEECDAGDANSDTAPNACRTACVEAYCGDGVVDDGEECDDGNDVDDDGCDSACTRTPGPCGDGIVNDGEECDDGNQVNGDGCENDCTLTNPVCGDGIVSQGEQCDDGNDIDGDGCNSDCTLPVCGNGVVDPNEECDDGLLNSDVLPDHCRKDCSAPSCGDGVVDLGQKEQCEPPGTLLCDDACSLLLLGPLGERIAPASTTGAADDVAACQGRILADGARLFERTRMRIERCVGGLARCLLATADAPGVDGCLRRARLTCRGAILVRDRLRSRMVSRAASRCGTGKPPAPPPIARLLDSTTGLGFAAAAGTCRFAGGRVPVVQDLLDCAYRDVQCSAESAVARTIPRAWELLDEADLAPEAGFPCVTDPQAP